MIRDGVPARGAARRAWWGVVALAACVTWAAAATYFVSFLRLATLGRDVELGFAEAIVADAANWRFAGNPLYGTLADGYAGPPYAPGMPLLVGVLLGLRLWNGWPLAITYVAGLALVTLAVVPPWRLDGAAAGMRRHAVALAVALAPAHLVALPLVVPLSLLHEGRADLASWALAMLAVVAADRATAGSVASRSAASGSAASNRAASGSDATRWRGIRWAVAAGAAAGLGFLFKQTALVAVPAVVAAGLVRGGRSRRQLPAFLSAAAAVGAAVVGGVALNAGRVGLRALFVDGPAFDRALGWAPTATAVAVVAAPPAAAWLAAQWIVRRGAGQDAWRAGLRDHAAVVALAVVGVPAAAALLRFDGSDSNQLIGVTLAWTWSMARTARTAAAASAPGAAAAVVCLLGLAAFVSPAWQRAAQPRLAGFDRTAPTRPPAVFRPASHKSTTVLARFAQPDALALVCGEAAAGRPEASFYDPRKPYRDAVRTGRIAPGIVGLVDAHAIGRGPATPLLAKIRSRTFACIVEPELLDRPAWLDYVGTPNAPAFAALGEAVREAYAPRGRRFEGRAVWWPRR